MSLLARNVSADTNSGARDRGPLAADLRGFQDRRRLAQALGRRARRDDRKCRHRGAFHSELVWMQRRRPRKADDRLDPADTRGLTRVVADARSEGIDQFGLLGPGLLRELGVELVLFGTEIGNVGVREWNLGPATRAGLGKDGEIIDDEDPRLRRALPYAFEHVANLDSGFRDAVFDLVVGAAQVPVLTRCGRP